MLWQKQWIHIFAFLIEESMECLCFQPFISSSGIFFLMHSFCFFFVPNKNNILSNWKETVQPPEKVACWANSQLSLRRLQLNVLKEANISPKLRSIGVTAWGLCGVSCASELKKWTRISIIPPETNSGTQLGFDVKYDRTQETSTVTSMQLFPGVSSLMRIGAIPAWSNSSATICSPLARLDKANAADCTTVDTGDLKRNETRQIY